MTAPWPPLNRELAWQRMLAIRDPITRRLVKDALGIATSRYVKPDGVSDEQFLAELPAEPLDLAELVGVVERLCADHDRLRRILAGDAGDDDL